MIDEDDCGAIGGMKIKTSGAVCISTPLTPLHYMVLDYAQDNLTVRIDGAVFKASSNKLALLPAAPKPPGPPLKLSVGSLVRVNGTLWGELSWEPPLSDLPIQRYKVFWSRQLQGATSPLISVLVNHQTVPRVRKYFLMTTHIIESGTFKR
jgi:hypothetical protein